MEQISEHIWSVSSLAGLILPIHVWLVVDSGGVTLVDTGMSYMGDGIMKFVQGLQAGPLNQILLTHGHSDHVGSVTKIARNTSVPVYAHRIELPYMNGEQLYPRRKKLEHNIPKGLAQPLAGRDDGDLDLVAGLKPYLAPGHSPGHVVYYHEPDSVLLAGDLFTSKNGRLRRPMPMFTADMAEALRSAAIVKRLNPARVEVCHGKSVIRPAEQVDEYVAATAQSFSLLV